MSVGTSTRRPGMRLPARVLRRALLHLATLWPLLVPCCGARAHGIAGADVTDCNRTTPAHFRRYLGDVDDTRHVPCHFSPGDSLAAPGAMTKRARAHNIARAGAARMTAPSNSPSPPSSPPTKSPIPEANAHYVVCGKGSDNCSEGDPVLAADAALHEVRCCSDTSLPGWKQRWGCSVWTQSEIDGQCHENKSYCEARSICAEVGADVRLCTKEELEAKCTRGSGCGHDNDLIWSSTEGWLPEAPSAASCDVPLGVTMAAPSNSPSQLRSPPTKSPIPEANAHFVVCGKGSDNCSEGDQVLAADAALHEVRCCSETNLPGWKRRSGCSVWTQSEFDGQCYENKSYCEARNICAEAGVDVRLCTKEELEAKCTWRSGCGYDNELIWSSTEGWLPEAPSAAPCDVPFGVTSAPHVLPSAFPSPSPSVRPIPEANAHYVVCGKGSDRCSEGDPVLAADAALHEVRCCSETNLPGWTKKSGCSVWAQSMFDGQCYENKSYSEAQSICIGVGVSVRLCTKEELQATCTRGSGCGHDNELIWSSTEGWLPEAPSAAPSDVPFGVTSAPSALSSASPSSSPSMQLSPTPPNAHHVVCGKFPDCREGGAVLAPDANLHEVRCCSDSFKQGWSKRGNCDVWVASEIDEECHVEKSYCEALDICVGADARLCTKTEIEALCTKGSGCSLDSNLIWSSTGGLLPDAPSVAACLTASPTSPTTASQMPSSNPSMTSSSVPSMIPSLIQSSVPSITPSSVPHKIPSRMPSTVLSTMPTAMRSGVPSRIPSSAPSTLPSSIPSMVPSQMSSSVPSIVYSSVPSEAPSKMPSSVPSTNPSGTPSVMSSSIPSKVPSLMLSSVPSTMPTSIPSTIPSSVHSKVPSRMPSSNPSMMSSGVPSIIPSLIQSSVPSTTSSSVPSKIPSQMPSTLPSTMPTTMPSKVPSRIPSCAPSTLPSSIPSTVPSQMSSSVPSIMQSSVPSEISSRMPSSVPSTNPSGIPSAMPSSIPSKVSSLIPTKLPSTMPTSVPSTIPSSVHSKVPSRMPSTNPSMISSSVPSMIPSLNQSSIPSMMPSSVPSKIASRMPSTLPTTMPTTMPSKVPSRIPSSAPSTLPSSIPSMVPSQMSSSVPSIMQSSVPSEVPSRMPSSVPSANLSGIPSAMSSSIPSKVPSLIPSSGVTSAQDVLPSAFPSSSPLVVPSNSPSQSRSPPTKSPIHEANAHFVVCGKGSDRCSEGDPVLAADATLHEVRCCSETSLPGWKQRLGCSVWTQSEFDGQCYENKSYCEAWSICAEVGVDVRLCTKEELQARCTWGSGCGHDNDLIWSSTEGWLPEAPSAAPCDVPFGVTSAPDVLPSAFPSSSPLIMPLNSPMAAPSNSPSQLRSSPTKSPIHEANAHFVVCGKGSDNCSEGDQVLAADAALHEVRCCSETNLPGWKKRSGCSVWTQSKFDGQCHENKSYCEARNICAEVGVDVRLCTKEELEAKCTWRSGCGYDDELIWSSTEGWLPEAPSTAPCNASAPHVLPSTLPSSSPSVRPIPEANAHFVVCGKGSDNCSEEDPVLAADAALHEVRCCSETSLPGWTKKLGCSVWTQSEFDGQCYENKSYCEAWNICAEVGVAVRLCTKAELEAKCTKGSGCGHDNDLIWSGTEGWLPEAPSAAPCDVTFGMTSAPSALSSSSPS